MFIDFLISLWTSICDFLSSLLPSLGPPVLEAPQFVSQATILLAFYVDATPLQGFFALLFTIFFGLVLYKVLNVLFNWVSGLF